MGRICIVYTARLIVTVLSRVYVVSVGCASNCAITLLKENPFKKSLQICNLENVHLTIFDRVQSKNQPV